MHRPFIPASSSRCLLALSCLGLGCGEATAPQSSDSTSSDSQDASSTTSSGALNGSGGSVTSTSTNANVTGSSSTGLGGSGGGTTDSTSAGGSSVASTSGGGQTSSGGSAASSDGMVSTDGMLEPSPTWPRINGVQWADENGSPIQAHGGGMLKVGEVYYWFGENRNPDGTFFAVSAYRSRDLIRWEHAHDVLSMDSDPDLKPANVERPKVVYNASTQRYVMWMHWENGMDYGEARAAVASSDSVDGDYTYHGSFRPYQDSGVMDHGRPGYMSRDCTLFVDDDGKGYFLSTSNENYDLHLYLLSEDYLSIDSRVALLFEGEHREAPALFKRGDTYFMVSSGSTGWDPNQAKYATSSSLTSGWSSLQNVADGTTFYSQSTYVLPVAGNQGTQYLYMGDRWAGAWGGRVNDSSYVWQPIEFPSATSMRMSWFNNVHIDAQLGLVSGTVDAFVLSNSASQLLLSIDGPADQNSTDAIQQAEASATGYIWRFNYDGAGYFRITNDDAGKVLDVPDESTEDGVDLHLWDDNGGDHQAWRLIDIGQGRYRIRNKKSGHYLGVAGASTQSGARIQQQAESGGEEQIWVISTAP